MGTDVLGGNIIAAMDALSTADKVNRTVAMTTLANEIEDWVSSHGGSDIDASQVISGVLDIARIPDLSASKITSGVLSATIIPNLDASKITTGTLNGSQIPNLDASKITTGTFDTARIPNLSANKITSDTFDTARIPDLAASKITTGTLDDARIPPLAASKITSGTLDAARIPSLDASKVTTGTFGTARIPNLDASKVTSGVFDAARIPSIPSDDITGVIKMYGGSSAPSGYLLCQGQAVSRSTYSALFSVIGTTFGAGNGSTTFNVPDLRGAAPAGAGTSSGYTQNETITLGSKHNDVFQGHMHLEFTDEVSTSTTALSSSNSPKIERNTSTPGAYAIFADSSSSQRPTIGLSSNPVTGTNGTPRTGSTTRGKVIGVNFIIKV
jgi:microcystin-dependent protein